MVCSKTCLKQPPWIATTCLLKMSVNTCTKTSNKPSFWNTSMPVATNCDWLQEKLVTLSGPHFSPFCSSSPGKDSKPRPCEGIKLIAAPQNDKARKSYFQIKWSTTLSQHVLEAPWRQVQLNTGRRIIMFDPMESISQMRDTFAVDQLLRTDILEVQVTTTYQKPKRFGGVDYLDDVCQYSMVLPSVDTGMSPVWY